MVSNRLEYINKADIAVGGTLTEATGIQRLYNCGHIDVEMLEVFVVCGKCCRSL